MRSKASVAILFMEGEGFKNVLETAEKTDDLFFTLVGFGFGALDCLPCFEI